MSGKYILFIVICINKISQNEKVLGEATKTVQSKIPQMQEAREREREEKRKEEEAKLYHKIVL